MTIAKTVLVILASACALSAQSSRTYFMASSAIQALPPNQPLYNNVTAKFPAVAANADVVTVFPEYWGIPMDVFATTANISSSHPWAQKIQELATTAKSTGKPIMLQLVLTRDRMVARAEVNNGALTVNRDWALGCYDFAASANSSMRNVFVNYTTYMVRQFSPRYLVLMVEANLYWVHCGGNTASWTKLVDIQRAAYDTAKLLNIFSVIFPSFKIEDIYGQTTTGFDSAQWSAMSRLKRDRLGLASYPYALRRPDGAFINPYDLPLDYLSRIRDRNPSEPAIVVTETGWNTSSLSIGDSSFCYSNYIYSHESWAAAYLNLLLYTAATKGFQGIAWWSHDDLITTTAMGSCYPAAIGPAYAACNGEPWCRAINAMKNETVGWSPLFSELVFKVFGTMGLRTYDGAVKTQLQAAWNAQRSIPWNNR